MGMSLTMFWTYNLTIYAKLFTTFERDNKM